jgi:hypothetical protein
MVAAVAARRMPVERREWGQAMLAELGHIDGRAARWRFALGCWWATLLPPAPPWRYPGWRPLAVATAGVIACLGLAAYGLIHYRGLRDDANAPIYTGLFVAVMVAYAAAAVVLSQSASRAARQARRYGLIGGLLAAAGWLALATIPVPSQAIVIPYAVSVLGPAVIGLAAARSTRTDPFQGTRAAAWSLIVGNLGAFVCLVTRTYVTDGRPYDADSVSRFQHSGAPDIATYAVGDNLGGAVALLVLPAAVLTLAFLLTALRVRYASRDRRLAWSVPDDDI